MNKKFVSLLIFLLPLLSVRAQYPFILTEDAVTLGKHNVEAGFAFEYFSKESAPTPDDPQSLYRLFTVGWHHGVSENVNFDTDWRGALLTTLGNGKQGFHWGEITVSTRILFIPESKSFPAIGIRSAVKMPNTKYDDYRLGSNQTDYYFYLLFSKQFNGIRGRMNLGFSILGDPRVVDKQDDVYSLNLALLAHVSERITVFGEAYGRTGYQDNTNKILLRAGVLLNAGILQINFYNSFRVLGNNRDFGAAFESSETWSIGLGITKTFKLSLFEHD